MKEQAKAVKKNVETQAGEWKKRTENAVEGAKEGFNKDVK